MDFFAVGHYLYVKRIKLMCYNPITIKTQDGYQKVKCGHCLECLREYQNAWSNRMYEEIKAHDGKAVFFTLTYSDENIPKNYLVDGELYRSYSDYNYDNTVIRYIGKKRTPKVCSLINGERIKTGVSADKVLTDAGIYDYDIIDFNTKRNNQEKFIEHVQRIYGDYLRLVSSTLPFSLSNGNLGIDMASLDDWFEGYEGDLFTYDDVDATTDAFTEVLNDDDYDDSGISPCDYDACYRNRPVMSFNSVRKEDVIKWLNRGLNKVKRNFHHGFKWFVTAEYGPRTLRPHYHGILFGVTREEAQCMFSDWNRHFGFSKIDNVDMTKGGTSYVAKYCAKGMYEHPLCARDFFYFHADGRFTEYHSKHFERCLEIFGVDFPIVDKVFHLVSKGLGISYVDSHKDYFTAEFNDINFAPCDATPTLQVNRSVAPWDPAFKKLPDELTNSVGFKEYQIFKNNNAKQPNNERKLADALDELIAKFKYQKITPKGETLSYVMPEYYRAKILSDGLRAALAAYVREVNDNLYREKFAALQAQDPTREDAEIVSILEKQDQEDLEFRKSQARKRAEKQLNKSKL